MKKLLLVFAAVLMTVSGHAQKTADLGIWGGSQASLHCDMDDNTPFQTFNLNFGAYFRYNFNARVSVRAMFLTGKFANSGTVEGVSWEYDKSVQDLSLQVEVNYLRFILGNKRMRFSPYVSAGVGVAYFPYEFVTTSMAAVNPEHPDVLAGIDYNEKVFTPTIPFGFGFKYTIGKRLGVGAEYQMRKYFSDMVDNLDDPLAYVNSDGETVTYNDGIHNNDWAGYFGVHLTYMIYIKKKACPAYDAKYW